MPLIAYHRFNLRYRADLKLVTGKKFTLVGTPEGDEIKDPSSSSPLSFIKLSSEPIISQS